MAKSFDLAFYNQTGAAPYQTHIAHNKNSVTLDNICYGIPDPFNANSSVEVFSISQSASDSIFISTKIYNSNILYDDKSKSVIIMGVTYSISGTDISIALKLLSKNIDISDSGYETKTFNITATNSAPERVGTTLGINALKLRPQFSDYASDKSWYALFPCKIIKFRANDPGTLVAEYDLSSVGKSIIDFDYAAFNDQFVFITDQDAYYYDISGDTITQIDLPTTFTNLSNIAAVNTANADSTFANHIVISGIDSKTDNISVLVFSDYTTDTILIGPEQLELNQSSNLATKINRIEFGYSEYHDNTSTLYWYYATDDGLQRTGVNPSTLKSSEARFGGRIINDFQISKAGAAGSFPSFVMYGAATDAGILMHSDYSVGHTWTLDSSNSYDAIGWGYSTDGNRFRGDGIAYSRQANKLVDFFVQFDTGSYNEGILKTENNKDIIYNDIKFMLQQRVLSSPSNDPVNHALAREGHGVATAFVRCDGGQSGVFSETTRFLYYNLTVDDLIKYDEKTFYFLISAIGCGDYDRSAFIISYDSSSDSVTEGGPGNLSSSQFWAAGDYFVFNNLITKSSFYFKSLLNLDLNTLAESQQNQLSGDEGQASMTDAGNILDVIPERSLLYFIGDRNIEVWEDRGASGFPYRKQPYRTIPYHGSISRSLFTSVTPTTQSFNLPRYGSFGDGFVTLGYDSERNAIDLIYLSNGSYKKMPLSKTAFYQTVKYIESQSDYTNPIDVSVGTFQFNFAQYTVISFIAKAQSGDKPVSVYNLVVDQNGRLSEMDFNREGQVLYFIPVSDMHSLVGSASVDGQTTSSSYSARRIMVRPTNVVTYQTGEDMTLTSSMLRIPTGSFTIKSIVLSVGYGVATPSSVDALTAPLTLEIYDDVEGTDDPDQSFTIPISSKLRQYVFNIPNQLRTSAVVRLKCTFPIIIAAASLYYEEAGRKPAM